MTNFQAEWRFCKCSSLIGMHSLEQGQTFSRRNNSSWKLKNICLYRPVGNKTTPKTWETGTIRSSASHNRTRSKIWDVLIQTMDDAICYLQARLDHGVVVLTPALEPAPFKFQLIICRLFYSVLHVTLNSCHVHHFGHVPCERWGLHQPLLPSPAPQTVVQLMVLQQAAVPQWTRNEMFLSELERYFHEISGQQSKTGRRIVSSGMTSSVLSN